MQTTRWNELEAEALEHFRTLLRIDTTNPPGNESEAARYVADVLRQSGVVPEIVEPLPNRTSVVARLPGELPNERALLMSSHLDVVPAEPRQWSHPPFAAEEDNGCIYGRGALDMKYMTAYCLTALRLLRRSGVPLKRGLVLAAVADEEAGSRHGSAWLVDNRQDLLAAEYGVNEVGGFSVQVGAHRMYPIQVAEKGFVWLTLTAYGRPGHGSIPTAENAVVRLARVVERLGRERLPMHPLPVVVQFMDTIGRLLGLPSRLVLSAARRGRLGDLVLDRLLPDRRRAEVFSAALRNTASPTMLHAGSKVNVIPSVASARVDCRILPGFTEEDLLAEIRPFLTPDIEVSVDHVGLPSEVPADTPFFRLLADTLRERDPGCVPVPYLMTGFSDSAQYARMGIRMYGFAPVRLPPDLPFTELFHGHDERMPIESFRWGVRTFCEAIWRACVEPGLA